MNRVTAAVIALTVYLLVDIVYITLAKTVYAAAVQKVQAGAEMARVPFWFAVGAYLLLLGGWWVLVGSRIDTNWGAGAAAGLGLVFGACIYGVFNFTVAAMFEGYRGRVIVQDLLWGSTAGVLVTVMYYWLLKVGRR